MNPDVTTSQYRRERIDHNSVLITVTRKVLQVRKTRDLVKMASLIQDTFDELINGTWFEARVISKLNEVKSSG